MTNAAKDSQVDDAELKKVIKDFLEMGHVENIVAMFRREPSYYLWSGDILDDERFNVRLGVSVLFEELKSLQPEKLPLAIPSLVKVLNGGATNIRGEAASVLAIIGTEEALANIRPLLHDADAIMVELAEDILAEFE